MPVEPRIIDTTMHWARVIKELRAKGLYHCDMAEAFLNGTGNGLLPAERHVMLATLFDGFSEALAMGLSDGAVIRRPPLPLTSGRVPHDAPNEWAPSVPVRALPPTPEVRIPPETSNFRGSDIPPPAAAPKLDLPRVMKVAEDEPPL